MKIVKADDDGLSAAAAALLSGGLAIIPTDTVYGLAAHPDFPAAERRLYEAKRRNPSKPIAFLSSGLSAIERAAGPLHGEAAALAARFWPGPLTIVAGKEAFRIPDCEWTRKLLALCGGLLRVTSANISGRPAPVCVDEAAEQLDGLAELAVDGGRCPGGVASAVVRPSDDGKIEILRNGGDAALAATLAEKAAQQFE